MATDRASEQGSGDLRGFDRGVADRGVADRGAGDRGAGDRGAGLVRLDVIGTAVFAVSAAVSAIVFTNGVRIVGVVVALALFAIGVVTFLWSYWSAVQRSRTDNIAVAQLYFLASGSTPRRVKLTMNVALLAQVAIGLGTAIARSTTDGRAGSTLAFGILVPMFGLGLNGLWCSRYGQFAPRRPARESNVDEHTAEHVEIAGTLVSTSDGINDGSDERNSGSVRTSDDEMEQNSHHG